MGKKNESQRGYIEKHPEFFLALSAIIWGTTFLIVKNAIKDCGVFPFLSLRFFIAFLLMMIFFYNKISIDFNSLKAAFVLGIFNFLAFSLQTVALKFTLSSVVGLITGLYVIFTPFVAIFILKRKVNIYNLIGAFLAFAGMYLLIGSGVQIHFGVGEILTLLCALAVAFHISFTEIYARKYNIYTLVTFQFLFIALFSSLFVPFEKHQIRFSFNVIFALIITSVFATVFAYYVQTTAQKYISATKTAIIYALEPLSAGIFGIFVGEKLNLIQIVGGILIIKAMIISEVGDKIISKFSANRQTP